MTGMTSYIKKPDCAHWMYHCITKYVHTESTVLITTTTTTTTKKWQSFWHCHTVETEIGHHPIYPMHSSYWQRKTVLAANTPFKQNDVIMKNSAW